VWCTARYRCEYRNPSGDGARGVRPFAAWSLAVAGGLVPWAAALALEAVDGRPCDAWVQDCTQDTIIFWAVVLIPWLTSVVLLASREALTGPRLVVMAFVSGLAFAVGTVVEAELNLDQDYVGNNDIEEAWGAALIVLFVFPIVTAALTAAVGLPLQNAIGRRRAVRDGGPPNRPDARG